MREEENGEGKMVYGGEEDGRRKEKDVGGFCMSGTEFRDGGWKETIDDGCVGHVK